MNWTDDLGKERDPKVLVACPTYAGCQYALEAWAEAFHAFDYENKGALMVDNSDENLHYTHLIRAQGIPAIYQTRRFNFLWDTMELSWRMIAEYAHEHGYDLIFSVEADVICPPEALRLMVEEWKKQPKSILSHRYHPRGLDNIAPGTEVVDPERLAKLREECWYDTLGCTLFPTELAYDHRDMCMAIFEVQIYLWAQDHGYERKRLKDLFETVHLEDPGRAMKLAIPRPWTNRAHSAELVKVEDHIERPPCALPNGAPPDGKWHGRRDATEQTPVSFPVQVEPEMERLKKENEKAQAMVNVVMAENQRLHGLSADTKDPPSFDLEKANVLSRVEAGGDRRQFGEELDEADLARQRLKWECFEKAIEEKETSEALTARIDELEKKLATRDLLVNELFAENERLKGEDRRAV